MFQTLKHTIIFACCIAWVFAYPFDYSERECRDMFPEALGYDAQLDNNPPFEILLSQNMYTEYAKIDVTLRAVGNHDIRGFLMQVRRGNCGLPQAEQEEAMGYFTLPATDTRSKLISCFGKQDNTVTNRHWNPTKEIKARFHAPHKLSGPLYIRATVVDNKDVFWTRVFSGGIREQRSNNTGMQCSTRMLFQENSGSKVLSLPLVAILLIPLLVIRNLV